MDKVKFGRALGKGARGAAKSLWEAAEAAAAPDPKRQGAGPREQGTGSREQGTGNREQGTGKAGGPSFGEVAGKVADVHRQYNDAKKQMRGAVMNAAKETAREHGKGVLAPVKKFSSVIWLQVTGVFFAVLTIFLLQGVLRQRGALAHGWGTPEAHKFLGYMAICAVFAYFTVSSFVRAGRRGKRH